MFKMWDGQVKYQGGVKGKKNISNSHVRVFNTNTMKFETSHVTDVMFSGEKECFEIIDEFGDKIKASGNHPFLTQFGWVEVKDLNKDLHCLVRKGGKGVSLVKHRCDDSDDVICRRDYKKSRESSLHCDLCGETESLEVDHIIRVKDGGSHDKDNLQLLCHNCHVTKDADKVDVTGGGAKFVNIESIVSVGVQKVYDISVEGHHNFIGNGFVVHNSWNEMSRRYKDGDVDCFVPEVLFHRPEDLHKGSAEPFEGEADSRLKNAIAKFYEESVSFYNELLDSGLAPEQARFVLPQGMETSWVWTGSLYGWADLCRQRLSTHAQYEVRLFAHQIDEDMSKLFPISWEALKNANSS